MISKFFSACLFSISMTSIVLADDKVIIVEMPRYRLWCGTTEIPSNIASQEAEQAVARDAVVAGMDAHLLKARQTTSGFPFLLSSKKVPRSDTHPEDSLELRICYLVNPDIPTATIPSISDLEIEAAKAAIMVCPVAGPRCIDKLQAAVASMFPSAPNPPALLWREAATVDQPKTSADILQALLTWSVRPIVASAEVTVSGQHDLPAPNIMRPLSPSPSLRVRVVPVAQGSWFTTMLALPN